MIGGPGAFKIPDNDWSQFPEAIRRKLVLELAGPATPLWQTDHPRVMLAQSALRDCMIGEKLWRDRSWMFEAR